MRMLSFAGRCAKEILRDPINLAFGLGFPLVLLVLLSAIQANVPVSLFEINALWMTKEKYIRLISLCSLPFWMAYNVLCGAWGSVVGNVLMVISIFTALYRHDRKQ